MSRSMASYITNTSSAAQAGPDNIKALFSPISAALRQIAPRTADSGQGSPVAGSASFEVYAFADALQATRPIYARLDYTNNSTAPTIQITVGTATNGTGGVLNGPGQTSLLSNNNAYAHGATRYFYASNGDGSYLSLLFNIQGQATTGDALAGVVIERSRDADGTANGNGYTIWRWQNLTDVASGNATSFVGVNYRIHDNLGTAVQNNSVAYDYFTFVPGQLTNPTGAPATFAGDTGYAYPVFTGAGNQPQGASKALALAWAADVPRVAPITLSQYGTPGTWLPMSNGSLALVPYLTSSAFATGVRGTPLYSLSPVFRWE